MRKNLHIIVHEFTHALGFLWSNVRNFFNVYDYTKYTNSTDTYTDTNDEESQFIKIGTPRLMKAFQDYFGCQSIEKIPMENEGGCGT